MKYREERMARSQLYVDRAVQWIRDNVPNTYASPIISQGYPDQGDAISWRLKKDGQKYAFRTLDAKEANKWTGDKPPASWGGLMLATEAQLHPSWVYFVINQPMTHMAFIDMEKWHTSLAETVITKHPETGLDQASMKMPYKCFKFVELK